MRDASDAATRQQVVTALAEHRGATPVTTAGVFLLDLAVYAASWIGLVLSGSWPVKLALALVAAVSTARLFVTGHDACHASAFPKRWANHLVGRIAFLASLTPFSAWELGHNTLHHGFTNLRGKDYVYTPLSKPEFDALPRWRRALERIYRSPAGPGLFYLIEVWWKKLWFPSPAQTGGFRACYFADSLLTLAFAGGQFWIALRAADPATAAFAVTIPFLAWNAIMGFVTYQHHTHPCVVWYANRTDWEPLRAQVDNTPHVLFPAPVGALLGNIMEHTAHHVDVRIPMFHLPQAQSAIEAMLPGRVTVIRWSWRYYVEVCRCCKLFDYENRRWLDFEGNPVMPSAAAG